MATSSTPPIRALRRALLVAMVLLIGSVAALFVLGRSSRPAAREEPAAEERGKGGGRGKRGTPEGERQTAADREAAVLSEGFDYEQQVDGKPVFRLQGEKFTTDRDGKVSLQGVRLELFREGQPYHVASRRANYDPNSQNAQLIGNVQLRGGDGWEVDSERLDLVGGGRVVVSRGDRVDIRRGASLSGRAGQLQFDIQENRLRLLRDVRFDGSQEEGGTPFALAAEEVVWDQDGNTVDAERKVQLSWGDDWLRADHVHAALRAQGGGLEAATAEGGVTGTLVSAEEGTMDLTSERASVAFDPQSGRPRQIDLDHAERKAPVRLVSRQAGAPRRSLTAPAITVDLVDGRMSAARASGGVVLEEAVARRKARVIRGDELDASFSTGNELERAEMRGGVVIEDESLSASGDAGVLDEKLGSVTLTGKPARAHNAARSQLNAPTIVYDLSAREVKAEGGVQGTFQPGSSILPSARGTDDARQPVHIESEKGSFSDSTRKFRFEGKVQAVQGESLLFADLLEGDEGAGTARATGKVRTIWKDEHPDASGDPGLTVVSAAQLDYDRKAGTLVYSGGVQVRQESRDIKSADARIELDDKQRARRILATGEVHIDDRSTGRTVDGAEADYDVAARSAIVTGEPVVIHDRDGAILRGRRALFDAATGSAKIISEVP